MAIYKAEMLELGTFTLTATSPLVAWHLLPAPVLPIGTVYRSLQWQVSIGDTGAVTTGDKIRIKLTTQNGTVANGYYNLSRSGSAATIDDGTGHGTALLTNAQMAAINESVFFNTNLEVEISFVTDNPLSTRSLTFQGGGGFAAQTTTFGFYRVSIGGDYADSFYVPKLNGTRTVQGGRVVVILSNFGPSIPVGTTATVTVNGTAYTTTATVGFGATQERVVAYLSGSPVGASGGAMTVAVTVSGTTTVQAWDLLLYLEHVRVNVTPTSGSTFTIPAGIYNDAEVLGFGQHVASFTAPFTPANSGADSIIPAGVTGPGSYNIGRWPFLPGVSIAAQTFTITSSNSFISDVHIMLAGIQAEPPLFALADTALNVITVAWITQGHDLKIASHRSVAQHIGHGDVGWDAPYTLKSNVYLFGMTYLNDHTLYLEYEDHTTSASRHYLTNPAFADNGLWSNPANASYADVLPTHAKRAWDTFLRSSTAITFDYVHNFLFLDTYAIGPSADLGKASLFDFGSTWGVVYSHGTPVFYTSPDAITWTAHAIAAVTGTICAAVESANGTLVGLSYSTSTKKCKAIRSRDRGMHWEQDSTEIALLPALDYPPLLVSLSIGILAVWVISDQPHFALTSDDGKTWR